MESSGLQAALNTASINIYHLTGSVGSDYWKACDKLMGEIYFLVKKVRDEKELADITDKIRGVADETGELKKSDNPEENEDAIYLILMSVKHDLQKYKATGFWSWFI